jgi:hypothetical protein
MRYGMVNFMGIDAALARQVGRGDHVEAMFRPSVNCLCLMVAVHTCSWLAPDWLSKGQQSSSPHVTKTQAVLAHMAALMVGLLDPLHLVRLEGRLGEVQQGEFTPLRLDRMHVTFRDVHDHAGLEGDCLGAVGHGSLPADDVEHLIPVFVAVRFDLVLDRDGAYGVGGFLDRKRSGG